MSYNNLLRNQMVLLQALKTNEINNVFIEVPNQPKKTAYHLLGFPELDKSKSLKKNKNVSYFDGYQVYDDPPFNEALQLSFTKNANYDTSKKDVTFIHNTVFFKK